MNAKERFLHALRREPVDRIPAAAVTVGVTVQMMENSGVYWPAAHQDAVQLARLAEAMHLCAGLESIKVPFDMVVEVEALGAPVDYGTIDTVPTETRHILNHPDELACPEDFFDRGRVPMVLQAISLLRQRYDAELPIVSSIVGPFSVAGKLFGFDQLLAWIVDHPEWVHQAMKKLTPLAIQYARAQVQAGADAVTIAEPGASGDLISPHSYRDFIAPYHRDLCASITAPTILHICGKSTRHTPHVASTGATAFNFDHNVQIATAHQHLDGRMALTGAVPTVAVLLNGTPEEAFASATECLKQRVHVLTPGCALAPHTPLENLAAMTRAAREWSVVN